MTPPQSPHSSGEAAAPRSLSPEATSHLASPSDDPPSHDHFPDITPPPSPATQLPLRDFLCRMYPEIPAPLPAPPSPLPSPAATPRPDHFTPSVLVLDVRSPAEHTRGHIPGSHSLPLFDDAERAQVGLCFKHKGRLPAIELGLQLIAAYPTSPAAYPTSTAAYPTSTAAYPTSTAAYPTSTAAYPTSTAAYPTSTAAYPTSAAAYPTSAAAYPTSTAAYPTSTAAYPTSAAATPPPSPPTPPPPPPPHLHRRLPHLHRHLPHLPHEFHLHHRLPHLHRHLPHLPHEFHLPRRLPHLPRPLPPPPPPKFHHLHRLPRVPPLLLPPLAAGPKLAELAAYARRAGRRPGDPVLVYCWRGGMRSASVCWLLRLCGYECASLHGGYRAFRRWVQRLMHAPSAARGGGGARREAAVVPPVERHADEAIGEEAISRLIEEGGAADGAAQSFGEQFARARGLQAVGAGVGAAAAYLQAMRLGHPLRGHCLMMAGASLGQEKRHDEAVRCFHAAAEALAAHAPLHRQKHSLSHVHELRAQSLEALGQTAEAEAAARQAEAIKPCARLSKLVARLQAAAGGGEATGAPAGREEGAAADDEPPLAAPLVLGGRTGSGKTAVLLALRQLGEQVIDLEGLAQHMGSAFGRVGQARAQPSNEMYENLVGLAWRRADRSRAVWFEHEGQHVGSCLVPFRLKEVLAAPPTLFLMQVPREARVAHLVSIYTSGRSSSEVCGSGGEAQPNASISAETVEELAGAIESLRKRRGGDVTGRALRQLREGDYAAVASSALDYYDGLYDEYARTSSLHRVVYVECSGMDHESDAARLLEMARGSAEMMQLA
ncbi:hypothetical protein AB1Y20_005147 [Prymnesium parvum]|uniref:Rhodanese domain-containing protein n=1 Tax=Prymnesium parvum TaxID=97485 RepID=A0AB34J2Y0_PRYPA